jgi:hypothetical protein
LCDKGTPVGVILPRLIGHATCKCSAKSKESLRLVGQMLHAPASFPDVNTVPLAFSMAAVQHNSKDNYMIAFASAVGHGDF